MKGENTKSAILKKAVHLARLGGLDALSIGKLAKGVGLSKSGLFAHFNSKQTLQLGVLETAARTFVDLVVLPALQSPRGEPRIRALFARWLEWGAGSTGGCIFLGAAIEYDDRPGELRDYLVKTQKDWLNTLVGAFRIAQDEGDVGKNSDAEQFAFEVYGIMMSYHLSHRLLALPKARARANAAFERLLATLR